MADALLVPFLAVVGALTIWAIFAIVKIRRQRSADETLPVEPYARHQEEIRRLRQEHAEADPALTQHPARRP